MLSAFDLFQAALLVNGTQCARRIHIDHEAKEVIGKYDYSLPDLESARDAWSERVKVTPPISDEDARRQLVLDELVAVIEAIKGNNIKVDFADFEQSQRYMERVRDDVVSFYAEFGISIGDAVVRVVDRIPEPYGSKGFSALTADVGDLRKHGIEPGIYLKESDLQPFLSEYFVAHELIHVWLGGISPEDSCTVLEEGVAEYLSFFGYIGHKYGTRSAQDAFKLYRLNSSANSRFDSYIDGLRQAVYLAEVAGGAQSLIDLAGRGRPALNGFLEDNLNAGAPPAVDSSTTVLNEALRSARALLSVFPRSLVVSATAYRVAVAAQDGMTFKELETETKLAPDVLQAGLRELDGRALMTWRKDEMVVSRNLARQHLHRGHLRYDFRAAGTV
jgi:hypothetical protein